MDVKEIAKFASGAEAFHAMAHAAFWLSGTTTTVFGIRMRPAWHLSSTIVNGTLAIALGVYAWGPFGRTRPRISALARNRQSEPPVPSGASGQGATSRKRAGVGLRE